MKLLTGAAGFLLVSLGSCHTSACGDGVQDQGEVCFEIRFAPVGNLPGSVVITDVNNDSSPDLITSNEEDNTVSILQNFGDGEFSSSATSPVGQRPKQVAAGDLDGDGFNDLVTANQDSHDLTVLFNLGLPGAPQFASPISIFVGNGPRAVALADLNDDDLLDLVSPDGLRVGVFLNQGGAQFSAGQFFTLGESPISIAVGDLDGDTELDLILVNDVSDGQSDNVEIFLHNRAKRFGDSHLFPVDSGPVFSVVGSLNGDSSLDLVTANSIFNTVSILLSNP